MLDTWPVSPLRKRMRCAWTWLLLAAVLGTVPFWVSSLDVWLAGLFFAPEQATLGREYAWPLANAPTMIWLYRIGSGLSWVMLAFAVLVVLLPRLRRHRDWRQAAMLFMTAVLLGSGLLVNAIGKDMTGRPRPRHLDTFQGNSQYLAPLQLGTPGEGKSFPCGHCSVGFAAGAAGLVLMQSRPLWGGGLVVFSLLLGTGIGVARMSAGGHFASDVIWSAVLVWLPTLGIWQWMQLGERRGWRLQLPRWSAVAALVAVPVLVTGGLMAARPFHQAIDMHAPTQAGTHYLLDLQRADLLVELVDWAPEPLWLHGEIKGYGMPNVRLSLDARDEAGQWQLRQRVDGWVSEAEAPLTLRLTPAALAQLDLRIGRGSLRWHADAHARIPALPEAHGRGIEISGGRMLPTPP